MSNILWKEHLQPQVIAETFITCAIKRVQEALTDASLSLDDADTIDSVKTEFIFNRLGARLTLIGDVKDYSIHTTLEKLNNYGEYETIFSDINVTPMVLKTICANSFIHIGDSVQVTTQTENYSGVVEGMAVCGIDNTATQVYYIRLGIAESDYVYGIIADTRIANITKLDYTWLEYFTGIQTYYNLDTYFSTVDGTVREDRIISV